MEINDDARAVSLGCDFFLIPPSILIPFKTQMRPPFSKNFLSSSKDSVGWMRRNRCPQVAYHGADGRKNCKTVTWRKQTSLTRCSSHQQGHSSDWKAFQFPLWSIGAWLLLPPNFVHLQRCGDLSPRVHPMLLQGMARVKGLCTLQCSLSTRLPITLF